ncbi:MAG TPA: hypothetical protein PK231_09720 [Acidocella sp.]|nr:hypothetical protein [Acidocella sp.]OYV49499.1 MAG: hypothetical protein B7Z77_07855 [Acidocella sp. 20-58-15]OYY04499.1 MAG: hypothetical protein B7Y73_04060 [Acidocella sp. 35-58-6]HQT39692.1 hypothetical protein [Acidocella sp.]
MSRRHPSDEELAGLLEQAQLASAKARPLPRRHLGPAMLTILIALRVYVILAIPVVAYAFIHALALGAK